MRIFTFSTFIILVFSFFVNAQWTAQNSQTNYELRSVAFINELKGFAVGLDTVTYSGVLIQTTDGGTTWSEHSISSNPEFVAPMDIFFLNSSIGIITSGMGKTIWRSTDGGTSWIDVFTGANEVFMDLEFPSTNVGYAVGMTLAGNYSGILAKTTDGGVTWNYLTYPTVSTSPKCIKCVSETDCFIGSNDTLWRTTNGGANWNPIVISGNDYWDLYFLDNSNGFVVGGYNGGEAIFKTTNGGSSWTEVFRRNGERLLNIEFANSTTGWACGENGRFLKTTDGGATWTDEGLGLTSHMYEIVMLSETYGFAVGSGGTILRLGQTSGIENGNNMSKLTIYPSPCTDQITFNTGDDGGFVKVIIYDILGNTVTEKSIQSQITKVNTSDYSNGLYFYKAFNKDGKFQSGKFLKK